MQRKIYADVTVRNLNTTKQLAALMAATASSDPNGGVYARSN